MVAPEAVAEAAVEAIAEERFLVLPHPEVLEFFARARLDRWLAACEGCNDDRG